MGGKSVKCQICSFLKPKPVEWGSVTVLGSLAQSQSGAVTARIINHDILLSALSDRTEDSKLHFWTSQPLTVRVLAGFSEFGR